MILFNKVVDIFPDFIVKVYCSLCIVSGNIHDDKFIRSAVPLKYSAKYTLQFSGEYNHHNPIRIFH